MTTRHPIVSAAASRDRMIRDQIAASRAPRPPGPRDQRSEPSASDQVVRADVSRDAMVRRMMSR